MSRYSQPAEETNMTKMQRHIGNHSDQISGPRISTSNTSCCTLPAPWTRNNEKRSLKWPMHSVSEPGIRERESGLERDAPKLGLLNKTAQQKVGRAGGSVRSHQGCSWWHCGEPLKPSQRSGASQRAAGTPPCCSDSWPAGCGGTGPGSPRSPADWLRMLLDTRTRDGTTHFEFMVYFMVKINKKRLLNIKNATNEMDFQSIPHKNSLVNRKLRTGQTIKQIQCGLLFCSPREETLAARCKPARKSLQLSALCCDQWTETLHQSSRRSLPKKTEKTIITSYGSSIIFIYQQ